jgi:hypothetical protein
MKKFLPSRFVELVELVDHRFQSVSESFLDYLDSVINAAYVLQECSQRPEMVDLILQNTDPGMRTRFVFFKRPEPLSELYASDRQLTNSMVASSQEAGCLRGLVFF